MSKLQMECRIQKLVSMSLSLRMQDGRGKWNGQCQRKQTELRIDVTFFRDCQTRLVLQKIDKPPIIEVDCWYHAGYKSYPPLTNTYKRQHAESQIVIAA